MSLINTTAALAAFCDRLATETFVTVDTEFMREKTYWSKLCLVQLAGETEARCVDPLAADLDLAPLFDLMANQAVLKVFHAARQDVEIFLHESGRIPTPIFDTQVAAMVCGFGDSVGYETLVSSLANARIDKTLRFTDWSKRPLSDRQIEYALGDVTHLRTVYAALRDKLAISGREAWLDQEMDQLRDPAHYQVIPEEAWRRIKARSRSPKFLALLRELAAWRERTAQDRDIPRNRLVRDEGLLEIAASAPKTPQALGELRSVTKGLAEGAMGEGILAAVRRAQSVKERELPFLPDRKDLPNGLGAVVDLLRVLLKMRCDEAGVAQKLVATVHDLECIAADDQADVAALSGWRRQLFGEDALKLKHGRLALALAEDGRSLRTFPVDS